MQQQRLDEKLILPSSLCLSLSACLTVSISQCVCVFFLFVSFCFFYVIEGKRQYKNVFVYLCIVMIRFHSFTDIEQQITSVQVSCQT